MIDLHKITGFDWDEGNDCKDDKHGVAMANLKPTTKTISRRFTLQLQKALARG